MDTVLKKIKISNEDIADSVEDRNVRVKKFGLKMADPKDYEYLPPLESVINNPTCFLHTLEKIENFPCGWPEKKEKEKENKT